jgi:hypothetical protein
MLRSLQIPISEAITAPVLGPDVEPLGRALADPMQRTGAAGADRARQVDDQPCWRRSLNDLP